MNEDVKYRIGAFLPQFDTLRVALWMAEEEKRISERKGREEDDKNIFLDRYKFSRWVKTALRRLGGRGVAEEKDWDMQLLAGKFLPRQ